MPCTCHMHMQVPPHFLDELASRACELVRCGLHGLAVGVEEWVTLKKTSARLKPANRSDNRYDGPQAAPQHKLPTATGGGGGGVGGVGGVGGGALAGGARARKTTAHGGAPRAGPAQPNGPVAATNGDAGGTSPPSSEDVAIVHDVTSAPAELCAFVLKKCAGGTEAAIDLLLSQNGQLAHLEGEYVRK